MDTKILIVGGGVAGLYVKNRLEVLGYKPKLVEQSPTLRTDGAGIMLGANVQKLFRVSGHEREILRHSTRIDAIELQNQEGKKLTYSDLAKVREKSSYSSVAIHRKTLHKILSNSVESATVQLGKKVLHLHEKTNGYEVEFEDGEYEEFEYIIGADGIHSRVRQELFGDDGLRDAAQSCWRFVCDAPKGFDMHKGVEMWGEQKRLGIFSISDNKLYCFLLANSKKEHESMGLKEVLGLFSDFEGEWMRVKLHVSDNTELLFNPIADLSKIRLAKANAILIGDAGHSTTPNLGQGAAIALESAFEFSELVRQRGLSEAMKLYASKRYNRVNFIRERSFAIGKIAHLKSPIARWLRNTVIRLIPNGQRELEKVFWGS